MAAKGEMIKRGKQLAAHRAVEDAELASGQVIGIGSGSTVVFAVEKLAERIHNEKLDVQCVPTSFQAQQLILQHKLSLSDLTRCPEVDITFDGADEVDAACNLIKGGGGCHLQEKLVASSSRRLVIVADFTKRSKALGTSWKSGIPLEVHQLAYTAVMKKLNALGHSASLRYGSKGKAGPVITDNGNFVMDLEVKDGEILESTDSLRKLDQELHMTPGVLETGLFVGMADCVYFGLEDGGVDVLAAPTSKDS